LALAADTWRTEWVSEKCAIAQALAAGQAGGGYGEAAIIISAAISALAAEVWPGRGIDRVRFIELLVRFAPASDTAKISIPLLVQELSPTSEAAHAETLRKAFLPSSPASLITRSVDKLESEVLRVCPQLKTERLRKVSYACLLYEEVRSSYAHQYKAGAKAESWLVSSEAAGESAGYANRLVGPDLSETQKLIHFHIEWLVQVAQALARNIDARRGAIPVSSPALWWIDGAP
jgi:hypothetical protein